VYLERDQEKIMQVEQRRFPRIPYTEPVTVALETSSAEASFRDISCQGAEIDLGRDSDKQLIPGSTVQLQFELEGMELALPARVVWTASGKAGLRLRMRDVSDDMRKTYAGWIVPLTNEAIAKAKAAL
jgi:hypothetical protein